MEDRDILLVPQRVCSDRVNYAIRTLSLWQPSYRMILIREIIRDQCYLLLQKRKKMLLLLWLLQHMFLVVVDDDDE